MLGLRRPEMAYRKDLKKVCVIAMNRTLSLFIRGKESELDDERAGARRCISELGFEVVGSEARGAYPGPIRAVFSREVRDSNIYVGTFGVRGGVFQFSRNSSTWCSS
jgi:hypothetical protein